MKLRSDLPTIGVALLLLTSVAAYFATRDLGTGPATAPASRQNPLVDDRMVETARRLSAVADTVEEQDLAREALELADHELDQAFATALRQAAVVPPPASGALLDLNNRIARLNARMAAYQKRITQLTPQAAADERVAEELAVLKAQQNLDEDEREDAQQDLERQGGDRHATLERALEQHEAVQKQPLPPLKSVGPVVKATLLEQVRLWLNLNGRLQQLLAARREAAEKAAALLKEHDGREAQSRVAPATPAIGGASVTESAVAQLRRRSDQTKTLSEYDKRIQACRQLTDVYSRWSAAVEARRRSALHGLVGSLAGVLSIVFGAILINRGIGQAFRQTDRRRLHQLRTVSKLAVQVTGVLLVLLILFGPPTQMTTLIGLATAGLTVALKDFIVGFFGWFVLLGRNGLHIGDWVEIEGVSGEVIEIGLLKTVLLEVGNWTSTGHPTGRRVAFVNSFAIEGHFFNFSTAGQWLWDQLVVTLPSTADPYKIAEQIVELVGRETESDARQAEQDWRRVTAQYGVREFSAKPAVELRPGAAGLEVAVRYITRAPQRFEVKSRLFQVIVSLLHQSADATA
ncbi:MAG: mechanosensitive ion channel [Acidobacteriota bacterium]|jgi:small-conductance mechanosensitive channel|nr:mechanosensitive ion channel [Acidobacteriota bacterium]